MGRGGYAVPRRSGAVHRVRGHCRQAGAGHGDRRRTRRNPAEDEPLPPAPLPDQRIAEQFLLKNNLREVLFRKPAARGTTAVEHLGAGGGFYNAMRLYPELELGIIAMANGGVIDEPVLGVGTRTGASYSFGERGKETAGRILKELM